jgi:RNA polymerase sigma factor (sigma-70 family)
MSKYLPTSRGMMAAVVVGAAVAAGASDARADVSPAAVTDISRYCQACWRNARLPADRWGDCTQQVFIRLLERVDPDSWDRVLIDLESPERREFVRAIDAVKKRTQRARMYVSLSPDHADRTGGVDAELRDKRDAVAVAANGVLSPRQKRIVELSAGGWAVPDIASELGTTVERVSDEKYKAIRKLRNHFGT